MAKCCHFIYLLGYFFLKTHKGPTKTLLQADCGHHAAKFETPVSTPGSAKTEAATHRLLEGQAATYEGGEGREEDPEDIAPKHKAEYQQPRPAVGLHRAHPQLSQQLKLLYSRYVGTTPAPAPTPAQ